MMTSFLDQLRREPLQLGPKYHSIDDYYNAQFPEPESSRPATDPWGAEELAFRPVARPELCDPPKRFRIPDDWLKEHGYESIDAYFEAEFAESGEQLSDLEDEDAEGWLSRLGPVGPQGYPEIKLPRTEDDRVALAAAIEASWKTHFAQPNTTFQLLCSFSKLAVVRPAAPKSDAGKRRLVDHAESYRGYILGGKCRPTLFGFNAEERRESKAVKFFLDCQGALSVKALGAFASWLSESWGTERFHRAGHRASKGPRCVTHEFGRVWSIQGDSNDYLVMFQALEESCAFFPLAYFPSGNLALFVDFLVSLRAVWWGFRVYPKETPAGWCLAGASDEI